MTLTKAQQTVVDGEREPPFFKQLEDLAKEPALPNEIHDMLLSQEALAAVFFAAEWNEAGLQLHKLEVIPRSPNGFPFPLLKRLRKTDRNRLPLNLLPSNIHPLK